VKWLRRLVLVAPAMWCIVIAWQCYPDAFYVWLSLLAGALWAWDAWRRIKEVESK
jgi:hypothetical protein